jgi:hypothetical protein
MRADPAMRDKILGAIHETDAAIKQAGQSIEGAIGAGGNSPEAAISYKDLLTTIPKRARAVVSKSLGPIIQEQEDAFIAAAKAAGKVERTPEIDAQLALLRSQVRPPPAAGGFIKPSVEVAQAQARIASQIQQIESSLIPPFEPKVTLEMLDVARKSSGSAAQNAATKPSQGFRVGSLKEAKTTLRDVLAGESPEADEALTSWLPPRYQLPRLPVANKGIASFMARAVPEALTGRAGPASIHAGTELVKDLGHDMTDDQAKALLERMLKPGPEGWDFAQKILEEAAKAGKLKPGMLRDFFRLGIGAEAGSAIGRNNQ